MITQAELAAHNHVPARDSTDAILEPIELAKRSTLVLPSTSLQSSSQPYGTDWDVLWLGHCSNSLPLPYNYTSDPRPDRFIFPVDSTMPPAKSNPPPSSFPPPHSRLYHRAHSTLCTLSYAITQLGARKILYEHGLRNFDRGYDFALGEWCDGETAHMGARPMCLSVSPGLFGHYYGGGGAGRSDIAGVGGMGVREGIGGVRGGIIEEEDGG